ncbi:hypothetical protein N780_08645 [Pontibacillus chungwhensis BH030062]|uniref:Uncharacterized protein n=1 Tax=Pontibacillus chungwhensis BH030062 TaxID=1385513 RepID=A0A0A2USQ7_9BACI|nr:hypothetical protein [Pontibacillus chungwhensis]KGP91322.1 hypothetical protein N780_08645 [Pontibacillus chungwhensis BH030062]
MRKRSNSKWKFTEFALKVGIGGLIVPSITLGPNFYIIGGVLLLTLWAIVSDIMLMRDKKWNASNNDEHQIE